MENEQETLKVKLQELEKHRTRNICILYKHDKRAICAETLEQCEILAPPKWTGKVEKVVFIDDDPHSVLTSGNARRFVNEIVKINKKEDGQQKSV